MRVLIDQCVDPRVKNLLSHHQVATVYEQGWDGQLDGPLLVLAQQHFDVFLTIDGSLEFQQNLSKLTLGIVVVHVPKNQVVHYQRVQNQLSNAIESVRPGAVVHVR
jgi:hypothetical protein